MQPFLLSFLLFYFSIPVNLDLRWEIPTMLLFMEGIQQA